MCDILKCAKLNGFKVFTPLLASLRTQATISFFCHWPLIIPSLNADSEPAVTEKFHEISCSLLSEEITDFDFKEEDEIEYPDLLLSLVIARCPVG